MKKITLLIVLLFGLSTGLKAQIRAFQDFFFVANGAHDYNDCLIFSPETFNILDNDYLDLTNNIRATPSNVTIVNTNNFPYLNSNGTINLTTCNLAPGNYYIPYDIYETANPSNISQTTFVLYIPFQDSAKDDYFEIGISGGVTPNVLANDFIDCHPLFPPYSEIDNVHWISTSNAQFTLNVNGTITVTPETPPGFYTFQYAYYTFNLGTSDISNVTINITNPISISINGNSYQDYNGDGITNVGDVINYQYSITNNDTSPVTNISVTSPNTSITGTIASLNGGATNTTSITGVYALTQQDVNASFVTETATATGLDSYSNTHTDITEAITNLNISSGIKLNAFYDTNNNGTQDSGEVNVNFGEFRYELNSSGQINNVSSNNGTAYIFETNPANTYNLGYILNSDFSANYSVSSNYTNVTVTNGSGITTYNFPITATNAIRDLAITTIPISGNPRPGFTHTVRLKYENLGNQISYGDIGFAYNPSNYTHTSSTIPHYYSFNSNNLEYLYFDIGEIQPFTSGYIDIVLQVATIPSVNLNDIVELYSGIGDLYEDYPSNVETNYNNNQSYLYQTVVGSYDPNDKNENHQAEIDYDSYYIKDKLTYTIRFENTGTASAINVKVNDMLDTKLNANTFKVLDASHPYKVERVGRNLSFKFDGIDLPPSVANTQIGKGFITYNIEVNPTLEAGDIVSNTANIFFDFNPPIVTNTIDREFVSALGTKEFNHSKFSLYPNPAKTILNIQSEKNIDSIEIIDTNGRVIHKQRIDNTNGTVNVESFSNGIYFIKLHNDQNTTTIKFIKN
jgi:uncharacterized repeat protein (TIGR01451 family)